MMVLNPVIGHITFFRRTSDTSDTIRQPQIFGWCKYKRRLYANPQYILKEDLWNLRSPMISIGMHGYEHNDATQMSKEDFSDSVEKCMDLLGSHPHFIPFYAYTWGNYS